MIYGCIVSVISISLLLSWKWEMAGSRHCLHRWSCAHCHRTWCGRSDLGKDLAMAPGSQAFPFPFPITVPAIFHPLPANTLADLVLFGGMSAICSCGLGPGPWWVTQPSSLARDSEAQVRPGSGWWPLSTSPPFASPWRALSQWFCWSLHPSDFLRFLSWC